MPPATHLEIVPLGGLGEFGLNLMVYRFGDECLVVDAGMMFAGGWPPGVDYILPDFSFLQDSGRLLGVVLTHAHEDHVGAVPHLLDHFDVPVWGTDYTLGLLRRRFEQRESGRTPDLRSLPVSPESLRIGPFDVEAIPVAHSVPQTRLLVLDTPVGRIVHSGDFKLDPDPPDGEGTDPQRLMELGREGVLALLSDSTNAECPGSTAGEGTVREGLDAVLDQAHGRVVLTTFASNVQRLAALGAAAERHGRRLALLGAAVKLHAEIAEQLDLLRLPPGVRVPADELPRLPPSAVLAVAGGSQGERRSAMARIAAGRHRDLTLEPGDTVVHAARIIPGNEKPIGRIINQVLRQGATVVTAADAPVHVSGHASAAELSTLIEWLRPRWLIPIHGEYRQLRAHVRLAVAGGLEPSRVLLAENGDCIRVEREALAISGRVQVGRTFMEASGDEVGWEHIVDRRKSGKDGVVVALVDVDAGSGKVKGYPDILTRGFTPNFDGEGEMAGLSRKAIQEALEQAPAADLRDPAALEERIELHLRRYIRRNFQRVPLIIARVRRP